jgi:hypothetical protein
MGRIKKQHVQGDPRRRPGPGRPRPKSLRSPRRISFAWGNAWDRAIEAGLMGGGVETKYHFTPDGKVLSVAVGKSGQALADGGRTPEPPAMTSRPSACAPPAL